MNRRLQQEAFWIAVEAGLVVFLANLFTGFIGLEAGSKRELITVLLAVVFVPLVDLTRKQLGATSGASHGA